MTAGRIGPCAAASGMPASSTFTRRPHRVLSLGGIAQTNGSPRHCVAAMNKFHATDTAMGVVQQGMDLLGQHAPLHRERLEKVYRDCRLTQDFEGTNQINPLAVIEDLEEDFSRRLA